jgi:hypothetical protein
VYVKLKVLFWNPRVDFQYIWIEPRRRGQITILSISSKSFAPHSALKGHDKYHTFENRVFRQWTFCLSSTNA